MILMLKRKRKRKKKGRKPINLKKKVRNNWNLRNLRI